MRAITRIAGNEVSIILRQPIIIAVFAILLVLAVLHGLGHALMIRSGLAVNPVPEVDPFFDVGVQNIVWPTSVYLSAVAMFIGILSSIDEKSSGAMRVLIAKPLYRRDIVVGKFLGISLLMLLLTVAFVSLFVASLLIFYGGPQSPYELIRVPAYMVVLYVYVMFFLAISMLIGFVCNNVYLALGLAGLFYWSDLTMSGVFSVIEEINKFLNYISPVHVLFKALYVNDHSMFDLLLPFSEWISGALPIVVWSALLVIIILLVNSYLFSRYDA
ncbi:ABC transporter permease [Methanocella conradii]|uniref:ABC transporter permease n=1 Tax=Methanocella conradii TaxID=1175444 RepID=UPI0024B3A6B5|nr:ABC transporter permease subunit [Methanocella conradii]MDI6897456.1 ABC transporter permease subunit [Methanocella conradii]